MTASTLKGKRKITLRFDRGVFRKAEIIAARECLTVNELVAREIERLVARDDKYKRSMKSALKLLDRRFDLGEKTQVSREELHERR